MSRSPEFLPSFRISRTQLWLFSGVVFVYLTLGNTQRIWTPWPRDEWNEWRPPWDHFRPNVVIRTSYGDVEGFSIPWHVEDEVWDPTETEQPQWFMRRINCFLGVPYAAPPVGKYRFEKPKPPRWGGVWQATYFRHVCPQKLDEIHKDIPDYPKGNVSEDCLYLNIFVPNITYPNYKPDDRLYPVIVWFHSGDFTYGTAQQQPGHVLATRGVVVVSINYRLGALGFLTTEDEHAVGNWGMYDQAQALAWVRENIQLFRGDRTQITLMGDGSGSVSVGMHLVSPISRGKGFYHKAILMSGTDLSMFGFVQPFWRPREYAYELGRLLNCPTHHSYDLMKCLRNNNTITWGAILDVQDRIVPNDGIMGVVWAPTQDGGWHNPYAFMPMTPWDLRQQGAFDKVPMIIGINTQDGAKKANESIRTLETGVLPETFLEYIEDILEGWLIRDDYRERVKSAIEFQYTYWPFPKNTSARSQELINMVTDMWYGMPMDEVIKSQCDYEPTYMYQYNIKSWNDWVPKYLGVSFDAIVPYVFGFPFMNETVLNETELVPRQWFDFEERNNSDWIMYMWTNFIKLGEPTPNITRNVTWEPYNRWNLSYLIIDDRSHIWFQYRQNKYSFWRDYFPFIAKQDYLYPTATPTPEGYEYVIATGSLTALLIVMFAGVGLLAYLLWYQNEEDLLQDDDAAYGTDLPFTFMYGRSMSQSTMASRSKSPSSSQHHSVV